MADIQLSQPGSKDIFSLGFDKNLNREVLTIKTPTVYDVNDMLSSQALSIDTVVAGTNNTIIVIDPSKGLWLGHKDYASAPFKVNMQGDSQSTSGKIGGFTIGSTTLVGGDVTLDSTGVIKVDQNSLANTTLRMTDGGLEYFVGTSSNAAINLTAGADPLLTTSAVSITLNAGNMAVEVNKSTTSNTGNFSPGSGDTIDLGTSASFWNEINYKTLTDRGCLGWFDEGVELQDGRKVSDTEAIKSIQKDETKMTVYGVPMLKYSSMPKAVFKPAPIASEDIYEGSDVKRKLMYVVGQKVGQDGAETTALISIMIGAIKELTTRVEVLEAEVIKLKQPVV